MVLATSSANSKNSCQHQSVEAPCSLLITAFFRGFWRAGTSLSRQTEVISLTNALVTFVPPVRVRGLSNTRGPNIHAVLHGAANRTVDNFALATDITKSELCVQSHLIAQGCENTRPSSDWPLIFTH